MTISPKSPASVREQGRCAVSIVGLEPSLHAWLLSRVSQAFTAVDGEIRVRIVDDPAMSAAHAKYSGIEGSTDVLTFDLSDGDGVLDVDILICRDEAARQATARGHDLARELLLYTIHGVLHCQGHDDHDPAAAARMHAEEDRILEAIGVGPTFGRAE